MSRLLPASLVLLAACDDGADYQGQIDALSIELENLIIENASQAKELVSLQAEIDAINGAIDLTALDEAVTSNDSRLSAIEADYLVAADLDGLATESWVQNQGYAAVDDVSANATDISANAADISANAADISAIGSDYLVAASLNGYATESWVTGQGYSTDTVDPDLDALAAYLSVDTSSDAIVFSGANVFVQSGDGATDGTVNGLGNLILGYDEDDGDDKSGSHNLVIGMYHTYSSYGGAVFGFNNDSTGVWGSVLGGRGNTASGTYAAVLGGYNNEASYQYTTVSGGAYSEASGYAASASGGYENEVSGNYASVTGGVENTASGTGAAVLGGYLNEASDTIAVVAGGYANDASGYASAVLGGYRSEASGNYSGLCGGYEESISSTAGVQCE